MRRRVCKRHRPRHRCSKATTINGAAVRDTYPSENIPRRGVWLQRSIIWRKRKTTHLCMQIKLWIYFLGFMYTCSCSAWQLPRVTCSLSNNLHSAPTSNPNKATNMTIHHVTRPSCYISPKTSFIRYWFIQKKMLSMKLLTRNEKRWD